MTAKKERLQKFAIKLPTTTYGQPDWQWMEDYIKNNIIPKLPSKALSVWNNIYNKSSILDGEFPLNTASWQWFKLKDIFNVERGKRLTKADRDAGNIPLITAGFQNQGVAQYIGNNDMVIYKDTLTIDMFGNCFFRDYEFCCDDNILVLKSKQYINKYQYMFICAIINKDKYKCAYGRQYRQKNFKSHCIKLPTIPDGFPDWQWMEYYIKALPYSVNL
jgi:hypothetical protein